MAREYIAPTIEVRKNDVIADTIERHPAYGQIGASRVSGQTELYGSDFNHQHYITIRLKKSELHRNLSNDRVHTRGGEVMEVSMSESQWATVVSSLNSGQGVQCTINYLDGQDVPAIKRDVNRRTQFEEELNSRLKGVEGLLKTIGTTVDALPCSQKKKDEIHHQLRVALNNMGPNFKFTQDQFGEYMEEQTERAKAEINAYAQHMLERFRVPGAKGLGPVESPVRFLDGAVDGEIVTEEPKS